jgi:hypothetical protein
LFLSIEIIGPTATNCLLAAPSPQSNPKPENQNPNHVELLCKAPRWIYTLEQD